MYHFSKGIIWIRLTTSGLWDSCLCDGKNERRTGVDQLHSGILVLSTPSTSSGSKTIFRLFNCLPFGASWKGIWEEHTSPVSSSVTSWVCTMYTDTSLNFLSLILWFWFVYMRCAGKFPDKQWFFGEIEGVFAGVYTKLYSKHIKK